MSEFEARGSRAPGAPARRHQAAIMHRIIQASCFRPARGRHTTDLHPANLCPGGRAGGGGALPAARRGESWATQGSAVLPMCSPLPLCDHLRCSPGACCCGIRRSTAADCRGGPPASPTAHRLTGSAPTRRAASIHCPVVCNGCVARLHGCVLYGCVLYGCVARMVAYCMVPLVASLRYLSVCLIVSDLICDCACWVSRNGSSVSRTGFCPWVFFF